MESAFRGWRNWHLRRWPLGLLGALGLIWGIECWVARSPYTGSVGWSWRLAREDFDCGQVPDHAVLVFGDSQIVCGLLPSFVQKQLDVPVYNLAVVRSQPAISDHLLEKVLASGRRPRAIVFEAFPGLIADPPSLNDSEWAHLLDAGSILGLAVAARDPFLPARVCGHWLLPSLEARTEIQAAIQAAVQGECLPMTRLEFERSQRRQYAGSIPVPDRGQHPSSLPQSARPRALWACRPEHEQAVRRFLTRAEANHIPVFWALLPLNPVMNDERERNGAAQRERAFVQRILEDHPRLIVCDGRSLGLDASSFVDFTHLEQRGAEQFSRALAVALQKCLGEAPVGPERWVVLERVSGEQIAEEAPDAARR